MTEKKIVQDSEISINYLRLFNKYLRYSNGLMEPYQNKHAGERCVIIGNGPSLRKMDLSFLKNEITFGMNRIYLGFEQWDFTTSYYVSVNTLVIQQSAEEIMALPCPKFMSIFGMPYLKKPETAMLMQPILGPQFSRDPRFVKDRFGNDTGGICEGATVTYVAMQLAYYMGFKEVVLIGVDHNFVTKGDPNKEVVSQGDDPDHFHPNYFGKDFHWHLPDLKSSEVSYKLAKCAYEADGRRIIDATFGGNLEVFPKADYEKLFLGGEKPTKSDAMDAAITSMPKPAPLVSVIVCAEGTGLLPDTLRSLEAQTYPNIEVVLVRPHGADKPETDKAKHVEAGPEATKGAARNLGVRSATGGLIAYLDEGNAYLPDHIAALASYLDTTDGVNAAFTKTRDVVDLKVGDSVDTAVVFTQNPQIFDLSRLLVSNYIPTIAVMHTREIFDRSGGFDETLASLEGWDFLIRLARIEAPTPLQAVSADFIWRKEDEVAVEGSAEFCREAYQKIYERTDDLATPEIKELRAGILGSLPEYQVFSPELGLSHCAREIDVLVQKAGDANFNTRIDEAREIITRDVLPAISKSTACIRKAREARAKKALELVERPVRKKSGKARAVIGTSIAPGKPENIEKQKLAVASWLAVGFDVISLNAPDEAAELKTHFPAVTFVEAKRDARAVAGKPFVYFDDLLAALRDTDAEIVGIINSDVWLEVDPDFIDFLDSETKGAMVMGSRVETPDMLTPYGSIYPIGFDYFFMRQETTFVYPRSPYGIGIPWWDYWAPALLAARRVKVKQILPPVGFHPMHPVQWSKQMYATLSKEFGDWIRADGVNLDMDQEVKKKRGENAALFLAVLKYIHDNAATVTYKRKGRRIPAERITYPALYFTKTGCIEPDAFHQLRTNILDKCVRDALDSEPSALAGFLTLGEIFDKQLYLKEERDIIMRVAMDLYQAGDMAGAEHALRAYLPATASTRLALGLDKFMNERDVYASSSVRLGVEVENLTAKSKALTTERNGLRERLAVIQKERDDLLSSMSWKVTGPLRKVGGALERGKRKIKKRGKKTTVKKNA
jgi:hypothetical protein